MLLLQASLYTSIDTKTHLGNLIIQMIACKEEKRNIIIPSAAHY